MVWAGRRWPSRTEGGAWFTRHQGKTLKTGESGSSSELKVISHSVDVQGDRGEPGIPGEAGPPGPKVRPRLFSMKLLPQTWIITL